MKAYELGESKQIVKANVKFADVGNCLTATRSLMMTTTKMTALLILPIRFDCGAYVTYYL